MLLTTTSSRLVKPAAPFLPFSIPSVGSEEIRELIAVAESGWLTAGPRTQRFEEAFREYTGAAEAVATSSCTAALHLALRALHIGPDDAVLTSPFTFSATANVIVHCGAQVLFADICPKTYNLDPGAVERVIREQCRPSRQGWVATLRARRRLRAVIAVHYAGQSCAMEELAALAERYQFSLVEDAAHAAGARYRGRSVGTLGQAGCFSFYPTKNMTTGEGGMLTSHDSSLAARARLLSQHGITRDGWQRYSTEQAWEYDVVEAGFKYNMTDLAAALGVHQLLRLNEFVDRRRSLASSYDRAFGGRSDLIIPYEDPRAFHSRHLYPVQIASKRVSRDQFIQALRRRNIGSSVHFVPLHLTRFYRERFGFRRGDFPVAEQAFERIVSLPLFPAMSDDEAARVIDAVAEILDGGVSP